MKGYSKINVVDSHSSGGHHHSQKSRSVDFSDLALSFPQTPKTIGKAAINHVNQYYPNQYLTSDNYNRDREEDEQEDAVQDQEKADRHVEKVEAGEVVLRRNCSVSSAISYGSLQSAVKRVFSMRRSSSVSSERYCRIYDQTSVTLATSSSSPTHDIAEETEAEAGSAKKKLIKGGSSKILKACKRFFRLY
ncbi:hypothetical protein PanWU01x14_234660 [Parasponia andersonii]|uniref:Uncharacterized protein n=1 Tax=Parasponia andersonii TaxID=3476 RepID=A0A2P5BJ17_PARAD|nr:hypothetical protein PanWU01x14_234660 [Parasponia andersonii]